jgi:hypothetical protein
MGKKGGKLPSVCAASYGVDAPVVEVRQCDRAAAPFGRITLFLCASHPLETISGPQVQTASR